MRTNSSWPPRVLSSIRPPHTQEATSPFRETDKALKEECLVTEDMPFSIYW